MSSKSGSGYGNNPNAGQSAPQTPSSVAQQAPAARQGQRVPAPPPVAQRGANPQGGLGDLTPAEQAIAWAAAAISHLYHRPTAQLVKTNQVDPLQDRRDLRLEFVAGSLSGNAGQVICETPAARLTAGGRPVAKRDVLFRVSAGDLGNDAKTAIVTTDASGTAKIAAWTLGAAGTHSVTAEFRSLQDQRMVSVNQG